MVLRHERHAARRRVVWAVFGTGKRRIVVMEGHTVLFAPVVDDPFSGDMTASEDEFEEPDEQEP